MSKKKPISLVRKHLSKEQIAEREREESLRSGKMLPRTPPAALTGHLIAQKAWRYLWKSWSELKDPLASVLDKELLTRYCLTLEQYNQMDQLRQAALAAAQATQKAYEDALASGLIDKAMDLIGKVNGTMDMLVKVDSRLDRKSALLHQLEGALYLSPRSRAGAKPAGKEPQEESPDDNLEGIPLHELQYFKQHGHFSWDAPDDAN